MKPTTMTPEDRQAIVTIILAMGRIQDAIGKHVHPEPAMTATEFIDEVLAAADHKDVVNAVRRLREQAEVLDRLNRI